MTFSKSNRIRLAVKVDRQVDRQVDVRLQWLQASLSALFNVLGRLSPRPQALILNVMHGRMDLIRLVYIYIKLTVVNVGSEKPRRLLNSFVMGRPCSTLAAPC